LIGEKPAARAASMPASTSRKRPPRVIRKKRASSSDLYSLGVVVYEWLTGTRPFQGAPMEVASQHVLAPPPPLRERVSSISPAVEQVVLTVLSKDPKDRFGSARAFANAFAQAAQGSGTAARFPAVSAPSQPGWGQVSAPTGQGQNPISNAPTHVTPQVTPQFSQPTPTGQPGQYGAAFLHAPTQVTPPSGPGITGISPTGAGAGAAQLSAPGWTNPAAGTAGFPAGSPPPAGTWATSQPPAGGWAQPQGGSSPALGGGGLGDEETFATLPKPPPAPPGPNPAPRPKGGIPRWALIVAACVVALALIGGGTAYAFTHFIPQQKTASGPTAANSAMVSITPQSSDLKDTFTIPAVTSTPDATKQVGARQISVTTQDYTKTAPATGSITMSATNAMGTLTFTINPIYTSFGPQTVSAGRTFTSTSGITVITDATITIPAGSSGSAPAHSTVAGAVGNIAAGDINQIWCPGVPTSTGGLSAVGPASPTSGCGLGLVVNSAFTGGQDAMTYPIVTQNDIDTAANALITQNQPDAQQVIAGQLQSGEQVIGTSSCSPNVSANPRAGNQSNTVTVTVSFTCTGEAYDQAGSLTLAKTLLMSEAQSKFGAAFALVGQVKVSQVNATQDAQGVVTITVNAEGVWVYLFSDAQKGLIRALIAGKTKADAMTVLLTQTGVAQVTITIPPSMGQILPTDVKKITLVVQSVPGV
jgi:VCBS repeat-containing protein